jgi:hypothetical protein
VAWAPFYRGRREAKVSRCIQWPAMKEAFNVISYWGNEEGVCHLMGK